MEQHEFLRILRKYNQGDASAKEKKLIDEWYASMGKEVDAFDSERLDLARVFVQIKTSRKSNRIKKLVPLISVGIAASVLLMVASWFLLNNGRTIADPLMTAKESSLSWQHIENTSKLTHEIVLPDSSKVTLEPESRLKFSSDFNISKREVYLEGEAFFEVTRNTKIPFLVFANEVTTKVIGTSFIIKAIKHERKITVVVKTGKVSVFTTNEKEEKTLGVKEIILTPNQKIVYDKKQKEISKMLVDTPQIIVPVEEIRRMRFEEAPVTEILKALEKIYGVEIEYDEEAFSLCRLTTVISEDDLYSRLDIICNVIGTSYTLHEDHIIMSSDGCKAKM